MATKNLSFQLDTNAAQSILTDLAAPLVKQSADAIAQRAESMAGSMSSNPPGFSVYTSIGILRRGKRAVATIKAEGVDAHQAYIGSLALTKAKDAGRV